MTAEYYVHGMVHENNKSEAASVGTAHFHR